MVLSGLPSVSIASGDVFNYKIKIQENGEFQIKINQNYGTKVKLSELFDKYFLNQKMQEISDQNMSSFKTTNQIQNKTKIFGLHDYNLNVVASKNSMEATINSKCSLNVKQNSIKNECNIISASSMLVSKLFLYGYTKIYCYRSYKNEAICDITATGKTKKINLFIKS